jgi:hypothetical protein
MKLIKIQQIQFYRQAINRRRTEEEGAERVVEGHQAAALPVETGTPAATRR